MSTLRVDNIKSRTGTVVTVPETNTLAVTGIVSVTSSGGITNAGTLTNTGTLNNTGNVNITGGITTVGGAATIGGNVWIAGITTISGNLVNNGTFTNNGTFNFTNLNVTGGATVGGALTVTGNLTVNGTTTTLDTINLIVEDKNIGIGTTTAPSNTTADGAGFTIFGGSDGDKTLTWNNNSDAFAFSNAIDIKGAVETVSVATTSELGGGKYLLECDAQNGTVFTHTIPSGGTVGIVSLRDFPVTKNSLTTYTIIFTQMSTTPAGTGNTTGLTGIGTNIFLKPYNVAGFSTSARVATASTITLSSTTNDIDIVSIAVHYNGSGTGTVGNYNVIATNNGSFRYGGVRP
jgi:hypothetical protein